MNMNYLTDFASPITLDGSLKICRSGSGERLQSGQLSSLSALAVTLRFSAFVVPMSIAVYWAIRLVVA